MRQDRAGALRREMDRMRRLPVFRCLDEEALRQLVFSAETRRLTEGEVLFRRGEPAEAAVLVAAGRLVLDGTRHAPAGTLLNETALFAPGTQAATAAAAEPATVISVSQSLMTRVLDVYPHNAVAVRRYWAERLGDRLAAFRGATR